MQCKEQRAPPRSVKYTQQGDHRSDAAMFYFSFFEQTLAAVAQLDRASDYGSEGLGFESLRLHFSFREL